MQSSDSDAGVLIIPSFRDPVCHNRAVSPESPLGGRGRRCGQSASWPRAGSPGSCQKENIFREPEGLAEPRVGWRDHNGPLCDGLAWTRPQAQLLGQGGPCFLICSQTQLLNNTPWAQTGASASLKSGGCEAHRPVSSGLLSCQPSWNPPAKQLHRNFER